MITIDRNKLLLALDMIGQIVGKKRMSNYILVRVEPGSVTFASSDKRTTILARCEANASAHAEFSVEHKTLRNTLKLFRSDEVSLSYNTDEHSFLIITVGKTKCVIPVTKNRVVPDLLAAPPADTPAVMTFRGMTGDFIVPLKRVASCLAKEGAIDRDFDGVLFEHDGEHTARFVASDRYRIGTWRVVAACTGSAMVPSPIIRSMLLMAGTDVEASVTAYNDVVAASFGGAQVISKGLGNKIYAWRNYISTQDTPDLAFDAKPLSDLLQRFIRALPNRRAVHLTFKDGSSVVAESYLTDTGKISEEIDVELRGECKQSMLGAHNPRYLIDAIRALTFQSSDIGIYANGGKGPWTIRSMRYKDSCAFLVMPMTEPKPQSVGVQP